jgi:hypothetical protein
MGCSEKDEVSPREEILIMLTNASSKDWILDRSTIDDKEIIPGYCDSTYVLTMGTNFTFKEMYLSPVCALPSYGFWELNDENNVISISYTDAYTGQTIEKHFEIVELTEKYFAYQFAESNRLKYVRLKEN